MPKIVVSTNYVGVRDENETQVLNFSQILASLSYALDLTSGYTLGHAQRSCLIGLRLGQELGLSERDLSDLYFALLLKDSGCSSNAARMYEIFGGDDIESKKLARVTDWNNLAEVVKYVAAVSLPKGTFLERAKRMLNVAVGSADSSHDLSHTRCSRGAQIALSLGMGEGSAACIAALEERFDGSGQPNQLAGEKIPLLSRIASISQNFEAFWKTFDEETAFDIVQKRSGRWFDPSLVQILTTLKNDNSFLPEIRDNAAVALKNFDCDAALQLATSDRIDAVCGAFAEIVDAKSPFTGAHSLRVCNYSMRIATEMGLVGERFTTLRRAALLHDIGKLSVPNSILDKPGKLDGEEWKAIRKHPYYSAQILGQIDGFSKLAQIAGAHHERLDGKGYHQGLTADELTLEMRVIAVADVFDALSAKRPYRDAMPIEQVFEIIDSEVGTALDGKCVHALKLSCVEDIVSTLSPRLAA